jgi:hypothetical protein
LENINFIKKKFLTASIKVQIFIENYFIIVYHAMPEFIVSSRRIFAFAATRKSHGKITF